MRHFYLQRVRVRVCHSQINLCCGRAESERSLSGFPYKLHGDQTRSSTRYTHGCMSECICVVLVQLSLITFRLASLVQTHEAVATEHKALLQSSSDGTQYLQAIPNLRDFDWTQMAGNSSEMTVAQRNHRTREYVHVADTRRPIWQILSLPGPASPPPPAIWQDLFCKTSDQLAAITVSLMVSRQWWGRYKWTVRTMFREKFPWQSVVWPRGWI